MARIQPVSLEKAPAEIKTAFFNHVAEYKGGITNMKATLGHSPVAFQAYMQWYPLFEATQRILGPRLANWYAFAISDSSNSAVCSTFFRKILIDNGDEPDVPELSSEEQLVFDFGVEIAEGQGHIPDTLYRWVSVLYTDEQLVTLIAFAGQMIATCVFNNTVETELDKSLLPYLPLSIVV